MLTFQTLLINQSLIKIPVSRTKFSEQYYVNSANAETINERWFLDAALPTRRSELVIISLKLQITSNHGFKNP